MISFFLIYLAAICNAVMDKVDHHFDSSIFTKTKNQMWWGFHESWRNKYVDRDPKKGRVKWLWGKINKPVQITDAWHFFKMLMIFALAGAIVCYEPCTWPWLDFIIAGTIWNVTFSIFYKKLFEL